MTIGARRYWWASYALVVRELMRFAARPCANRITITNSSPGISINLPRSMLLIVVNETMILHNRFAVRSTGQHLTT